MRCVICKNGELRVGVTTVTLTRQNMTLVFKGVPAKICDNCGEEYIDETASERLLNIAEEAAHDGVQVDVRDYVAA